MSNSVSTAIPTKALADAFDHLKQTRAALEPYLHAHPRRAQKFGENG